VVEKTITMVKVAVDGSPARLVGVGVRLLKSGRKGVFEGGRKAARSLADPWSIDPGIDPVTNEQPNTSVAAVSQNNLRYPLASFIIRPSRTSVLSLKYDHINSKWNDEGPLFSLR
jgi:hypothetical protein